MASLTGGNNPRNAAHVDDNGRLQTKAVGMSEQTSEAVSGNTYNINTGNLTFTNDSESAIFYLRNDSEINPIVVTRIFLTFLSSTAGSGAVNAKIYKEVAGGDILTATAFNPGNFNHGSRSKLPGVVLNKGSTASTFTATALDSDPGFLFTSDNQRQLIPFEAIVLPRGAEMLLTWTPPASNTSIVLQAGANFYVSPSED